MADNQHGHPHGSDTSTDPALEGILASLDRLADAERGEPDAGFERRIAGATRPSIAGRIDAHTAESRSQSGSARRWYWAVPLAAAVVAAVMLAPRPAPVEEAPSLTLASAASDLEDFLFIAELTDADDELGDVLFEESESVDADELLFELFDDEGSAL